MDNKYRDRVFKAVEPLLKENRKKNLRRIKKRKKEPKKACETSNKDK